MSTKTDKYCLFGFLSLFAIQVISLLYTENTELGLKFIEYKLTFLILPIIIGDLELTKEKVINLLRYFSYSIVAISVFLLINSFVNYFNYGELLTYHSFSESNSILNVHAVFYSYYVYFTILILAYLNRSKQIRNKYVVLLMLIPLVVALVFAASKNVMVITFLSVIFYLLSSLVNKVRWKEVLIVLTSFLLAIFLISKIPIIEKRVAELTDLSGMELFEKVKKREWLTAEERAVFNGTSLRLAFWYVGCSEVIDNKRLLIGLSPGDSKALINKRYDELNLLIHFRNYNMHNQYLQYFVEFGLLGVVLYVAFLVLLLFSSVENKNSLLLAFIIGFLFFQLTESVLERNKGILFFVFFLLLLLKLNIKKEHENSNSWN